MWFKSTPHQSQQTRLATEKQNYDCLFVVITNRRVERIRRYALIIFRRR
uniref:Uncharacterized protein n=1 Tax=virus sp. ctReX5 TaxID=2825818 RepID=A0A8S5RKX4_9VIRU|nr:MAG TPA: hypothetical protein [virus sp. ctReX5]